MSAKTAKQKLPQAIIAIALLFSITGTAINMAVVFSKKPEVIVRDPINDEIAYWQKIIKQNPTYRDAYLNLSQLYVQKGNLLAAQSMIRTAQVIDPLNNEVIEYGKVLGVSF